MIAPLYNEEDNVSKLITELSQFAKQNDKYHFNFVLVNDGSSDATHQNILKEKDSRIKYIKLSKNFGKEAAMLAGLDYSTNVDASVIIDGDLQMPIKYIKEMLARWEAGSKLIVCKKSERDTSTIKGFLARRYYHFFSKMANQNIIEDALDYTLMDQQVVIEVTKMREINRFFKGVIAIIGFEPDVLEVKIIERTSGESSFNSFSQLFKYAFTSLSAFSNIPLYLGIYVGIISTVVAFVYGVIIIIEYFAFATTVPGYSSLMCTLLFFFGILLIVLGIIGYYIGLILDEVKNRQVYVIDKIYSKDKE